MTKDKLLWMLVGAAFAVLCWFYISRFEAHRTHVEQDTTYYCRDDKTYLRTNVWHQGQVVWSKSDPVVTITDSVVRLRYKQADTIVQALKKAK